MHYFQEIWPVWVTGKKQKNPEKLINSLHSHVGLAGPERTTTLLRAFFGALLLVFFFFFCLGESSRVHPRHFSVEGIFFLTPASASRLRCSPLHRCLGQAFFKSHLGRALRPPRFFRRGGVGKHTPRRGVQSEANFFVLRQRRRFLCVRVLMGQTKKCGYVYK